jgi:hypothetical protein
MGYPSRRLKILKLVMLEKQLRAMLRDRRRSFMERMPELEGFFICVDVQGND